MTSQFVWRVMVLLVSAAPVVMLPACGGRESKEVQIGVPWTSSDLIGYRLVLKHTDAVEEYRFNERGSVAVTMGSKSGPVAAPVMHWRIDEKGVLNIDTTPGKPHTSLIKVEVSEDRVVALVSGERREYSRTEVK